VTSTAEIEAFLRRAPEMHLYELGDLDPLHASHTTWLTHRKGAALDAVVLVYGGLAVPTLVALGHAGIDAHRELLASERSTLPPRFYAHLSPGLAEVLQPRFRLKSLGLHAKMALRRAPADAGPVVRFASGDAAELTSFYAESYPTGYFEPHMLESGPFVGIRDAKGIACVAGVHVFSKSQRVAALGSIATRPDQRGRGLARAATSALCRWVRPEVDHIGLNVVAGYAPAIACYRRVGFEQVGEYEEYVCEAGG
jgi:ribosomal protein S18 acetylase RimI-like enzyme